MPKYNKEIEGVFYNQPKMSEIDWQGIFVLDKETSSSLWQQYISPNNRHFMLLANNEWPSQIVQKENFIYNWSKNWDDNNIDGFRDVLLELNLPANSEILFFWMQEIAIKTTWQIFTRNWINFLYEDEGCILLILKQNKSLILSNGKAWFRKIETV